MNVIELSFKQHIPAALMLQYIYAGVQNGLTVMEKKHDGVIIGAQLLFLSVSIIKVVRFINFREQK